jgi:signal transduction histidine kinase
MPDADPHGPGVPGSDGPAQTDLRRLLLDLHDGPMQLLYAALLQLDLLHASLNGDGEPAHRATGVRMLLERASIELRRLIERQPAPPAESPGLLSMLREVAAHHQLATQTTVSVVAREQLPEPGPEGSQAFYRILQESLSNALRHGRAAEVAVRLGLSEEGGVRQLWMSIEDDGCGFDPARVTPGESGLAGMGERMHAAGGRLAVESAPGSGTTVRVALEME